MSGIRATAVTGEVTTGTSTKTLVQIVAAANHKVLVRGFGIYCNGVSPTAKPLLVRVLRQTTAGTMSSLTPKKTSSDSETLQTTAQHTASAEPTAGDVLYAFEVHPQSFYEKILPFDAPIEVPGGGRLGIDVVAEASVGAVAMIDFEE